MGPLMFPNQNPQGTTLDSLFTKVVPDAHARFVPAGSDAAEHKLLIHVAGAKTYTLSVRGKDLAVREGEEAGCGLWAKVEKKTVELFLDDWMGAKRWVPKFVPPGGLVLMTDPRILKRVTMVSAKVELSVPDFEGGPISMTVAAGDVARRGPSDAPADTTVETTRATFEKILSGALAPEDAIADGKVTLRGKALVAMQFAFALAPFFARA